MRRVEVGCFASTSQLRPGKRVTTESKEEVGDIILLTRQAVTTPMARVNVSLGPPSKQLLCLAWRAGANKKVSGLCLAQDKLSSQFSRYLASGSMMAFTAILT
jgi:hypothetical protein